MGYRFRARIEEKTCKTWFGLGKRVKKYRYVLERHHMSWKDDEFGYWCKNKSIAVAEATRILDSKESQPKGEYITTEN